MADYMYPTRPRCTGRYDYNDYHDDYRRPRNYGPERHPMRHRSLDDSYGRASGPPNNHRRGHHPRRGSPSPGRHRRRRTTRSLDRSPPYRHHHHHDNRRRSPSRGARHRRHEVGHDHRRHGEVHDTRPDDKMAHSAKAAIDAAAIEAIRVRREPGGWAGQKGARVATAALGAAATDTAADKLRDHDEEKHSKRHAIESAVGGLLANRVLNGPRDDLRRGKGRRH